ncbi:MAG TPA: tripartite tricarboxylate transporter substrate-binding protein [Acidimicrobiia bacterium]|nr:tripartite tricarboxylate transporter substrate-binding protein [Acidimicrobiia bacterium]
MLRRLRRGRVAALMVATMALALVAAACGDDSGDYPSQNFRWVVPYSAGGGFDTYSRGFAEVMAENQLPGGVEIGVENITPIAEGLSTAFGGDEYTLAMLPMPAASAQQVLFPDIAKWDVEEFTVLGSIEENAYVIYVNANGPYQTWEDLAGASGLKALTVEKGSTSGIATAVAIRSLGLDAELTFGAEGSQEVATALVRGDIDFIVYGTSDVLGFIDSGDLKGVLFLGLPEQRPAAFEWLAGVPSAGDVGFPDVEGAVTEMRVVVAAPNLPDDVVAYLEKAVADTLADPDFAAWSEEAGRPIVPRNAESAKAAMANQIAKMKELVPLLQAEGLI